MNDLATPLSGVTPLTAPATDLRTPPAASAAGANFGSVLSQMVVGTISDMKAAESASISGLTGATSVQQVVDTIGTAQDSLNITMAVRNKVLAAYQQISQMAF